MDPVVNSTFGRDPMQVRNPTHGNEQIMASPRYFATSLPAPNRLEILSVPRSLVWHAHPIEEEVPKEGKGMESVVMSGIHMCMMDENRREPPSGETDNVVTSLALGKRSFARVVRPQMTNLIERLAPTN